MVAHREGEVLGVFEMREERERERDYAEVVV